jgi:hypothetical protein
VSDTAERRAAVAEYGELKALSSVQGVCLSVSVELIESTDIGRGLVLSRDVVEARYQENRTATYPLDSHGLAELLTDLDKLSDRIGDALEKRFV